VMAVPGDTTTEPAADPRAQLPPPRFLRHDDGSRLLRALEDAQGRVRSPVQFIAAGAAEGTSSLARDFSLLCVRELGQRVLLLDLDPPGDRQSTWFMRARGAAGAGDPVATFGGLPRELDDTAELFGLHEIGTSRLHLNRRLPPTLLTGAQWRATFAAMTRAFGIVVIDAPALARSFDGVSIAAQVATSILVVEAETAQADATRTLRDRIEAAGGDIAGCVMNKRRSYLPGWL